MRPRLLDLFCCAGGASTGYDRAGFDVTGVDIDPQPRYPFTFVQGDALTYLAEHGHEFDAIAASPPCQMYSRALKHMAAPQPMLIDATLELLEELGLPYVVENVEGAPLLTQESLFGGHGIVLCGTAFGLRIYRHRLFESNVPLVGLPCNHKRAAMNPHNVAGREAMYAEFGRSDPEVIWRREMGLDWMGRYEAREAIPPIYTEFIGKQIASYLA